MAILGYLERPYLVDGYLSGFQEGFATPSQVRMVVDKASPLPSQAAMRVENKESATLSQVLMEIAGTSAKVASQVNMIAGGEKALRSQANAITDGLFELGVQINMLTVGIGTAPMQQKRSPLFQALQGDGYLEAPYLTNPYLAWHMQGYQGMQVLLNPITDKPVNTQVNLVIDDSGPIRTQVNMICFREPAVPSQALMRILDRLKETHSQVLQVINAEPHIRSQVLMRVADVLKKLGSQVNRVKARNVCSQATMVLYNTTQLRMLKDFVSRGTPALGGNNWTVDPPAAAGDFGPNNLNTDVIEQVYRSQNGQQSYITLTCDTGLPQGAFVDTLAMLGHNLTRSAVVTLQGANNAGFSPVGFSTVLTSEEQNLYYIAPDLPTAGWRYWRLIIQDGTNPMGYVQIGTIIFGAAEIFSMLESFVNPLVQNYKHFKDAMETEGFTTVSNDRALRKSLKIAFEKLLFNNGNFRKLRDIMLTCRTSLKVLYIPTPEFPSRFAIFGKLAQMPETTHTSIDEETEHVDLTLDIDEST